MRWWRDAIGGWGTALMTTACGIAINAATTFSKPASQEPAVQRCLLEPGPQLSVVAIENSETLRLDNGQKVRLLGLVGPRAPLTAQRETNWQPEREARAALKTLVAGRNVHLAYDNRRKDRYGRLLAHVFVWHNGERFWVQGELLAHGHARAAILPGNTRCVAALLAHEHLARDPARGLWRHRHYRILKPNPPG